MQVQALYIIRIIGYAESKIAYREFALDTFCELSHRLFRGADVNQFFKIHFKADLSTEALQVLYAKECANKFQLQVRIYLHENFRIIKIAHNEIAVENTCSGFCVHAQQAELRRFQVLSISVGIKAFKGQ